MGVEVENATLETEKEELTLSIQAQQDVQSDCNQGKNVPVLNTTIYLRVMPRLYHYHKHLCQPVALRLSLGYPTISVTKTRKRR